MLVTRMFKLNYIIIFWAYGSLHSMSKDKVVCKIRFVVVSNNARLEWDSNLILRRWNEFLHIQTKRKLSRDEPFWTIFISYPQPNKGLIINAFNADSQL